MEATMAAAIPLDRGANWPRSTKVWRGKTNPIGGAGRPKSSKQKSAREEPAMPEFDFRVNIVAQVRVQADDENAARKIVPTILAAPGATEIRLANEGSAVSGRDATVTDVIFSIASVNRL
jgi:hypothetical protein